MRTFNPQISQVDYDNLPEALQRKYFSSLERLRFAQDGTCSNLASRPHTARTEFRSTFQRSLNITSRLDIAAPSRQVSQRQNRRRLQKSDRNPRRPSTAITTPLEYASLPPTLQKKLFSREEQIIFASRIPETILDAADQALCKRFRQQSISDYGWSSNDIHNENDFLTDDEHNDDSNYYDEFEASRYSEDEMNASDLDSFRWLDQEEELDLSLDDYHTVIAENAARLKATPWTQSSRRGLSLSNVTFRRRSSSSISVRSPPPPPLPQINTQISTLPKSGPIIRHHSKPSTSSLDPTATHYQDPAARLKLRVYLASPQKFDEAIEFGFPALQEQNISRPKTSPLLPGPTAKTFFNDDTPSLSADEENSSDKEEYRRYDSPCTPETPIFPSGARPSYKSSMDKQVLRPQLVPRYTDTYGQLSNTDREMTLHMTLTRPDLRSPDEIRSPRFPPRANNINDTPLEHAPLTVTNNVASIWDELPEEPSKVKRFFKKVFR